jgi:glyoxylase-like metal-dependent hydrolase (beta-lactamase superfamily II)
LLAPNPSRLTGPGTNTYIVGAGEAIIVDPGPNIPEHISAVASALEIVGAVAAVVVPTHAHNDHAGCARPVADLLKISLMQWGDPLVHGSTITTESVSLLVQHTPGHIHNHLALWLAEQKLLFAGDLLNGAGSVLVIPPDGSMTDYLASLAYIQTLEPAAILPGHGPVLAEPEGQIQRLIDHRLKREQQVYRWYQARFTDAHSIALKIYGDQPNLVEIATLQVEAHLIKLREEGRIGASS